MTKAKAHQYGAMLDALADDEVPAYLSANSGLPGPRANLELIGVFAERAPDPLVHRMANAQEEYLRCCGVVGLGRLAARASVLGPGASAPGLDDELVEELRGHARDAAWRVREAAAMALQRLGDDHPDRMRTVVAAWVRDEDPLVRRAAVAGICEPRLLKDPVTAGAALDACSIATAALRALPASARRRADVRVLRQALGYCWSVAVAGLPDEGLSRFAALRDDDDADVAWVVRENLRKNRLSRLLA